MIHGPQDARKGERMSAETVKKMAAIMRLKVAVAELRTAIVGVPAKEPTDAPPARHVG